MKIDTTSLARRIYNFTSKKTRDFMDRFTVESENQRRSIYNAQRDSGKVDYLPPREVMKEQGRIKNYIKKSKVK